MCAQLATSNLNHIADSSSSSDFDHICCRCGVDTEGVEYVNPNNDLVYCDICAEEVFGYFPG